MKRPRPRTLLLIAGVGVVLALLLSPRIVSSYWKVRSSNPVRRGTTLARDLGCFTCHGELGRAGIPNPGSDETVPQWDGSVWMMYVGNDEDIRRYIAEGSPQPKDGSGAIGMPAYGDVFDDGDLDDLVAAFKVLSGMVAPARGTPARAGYELARDQGCFACHAPGGAGGLPNPRSFAGFVPGWYGADFEDLVRDRGEFDAWILEGKITRLTEHPIARHFLSRQRLAMPPYAELTGDQLDELWSYTEWLGETEGGHRGEVSPW